MKDANGNNLVPISDAQKDLGLGPCLMLMTSKSIAYLFLILSIINIPLFLCYNIDNHSDAKKNLSQMFFRFSIGNIGQEEPVCLKKQLNIATNEYEDLSFECKDGKMSSI